MGAPCGRRLLWRAAAFTLSAALSLGAWVQATPLLAIGADVARVGWTAWAGERQAAALEREAIPEPVYRERVAATLDDGDLVLLESYLAVGEARGYRLPPALAREVETALAAADRPLARAGAALQGCLAARGDDLDALGGQLACDLLVIGDVRDLAVQGWRYGTGDEPDPVVAALAGAGLALEVGTVASGGALTPVNLGAAGLKIARRTGTLTADFAGHLVRLARRGDTAALRGIAAQSGRIATHTSAAATVRLLRVVDRPGDLAKLERASAIGGKRTVAWVDAAGRRALDVGAATTKIAAKLAARLAGLLLALLGALASLAAALALPRLDPGRRLARRCGAAR